MININNCINPNVGENYKSIKVTNTGLFICRFSVSYIYKGQFYSKSSAEFGTQRTEKIRIPDAAVQCSIIVSYYYDQTHTEILYRQNFQYAQDKCFMVSGTVASPACQEIPCSSLCNIYKWNYYCNCRYNYY